MTERMQYLWCDRWPLIFWLAFAIMFQAKSLVVWCLTLSFFILLTKLGKAHCYFLAFAIGFPIAVFLV